MGWGEEDVSWFWALLAITLGAYGGAATLTGLMYHWFKPAGAGDCSFNMFVVTMSLLLCFAFSAMAFHPKVPNGSIFPAAAVSLYCTYLCFGALQSEPHDYACNGLAHHKAAAASSSSAAVGMVFTMLSVVYAAFRAGSNTNLFSLEEPGQAGGAAGGGGGAATERLLAADEAGLTSAGLDGVDPAVARLRERKAMAIEEFTPVSYNYSFFHLIFALASMYIAMLMTGWGSSAQETDSLDVGWTSVWVKIMAQWLTAALYVWTLVAPMVLSDRAFDGVDV